MPKHTMKVAKTSIEEIGKLYALLNELESLHEDFQRKSFDAIDWEDYELLGTMGIDEDRYEDERNPLTFIEDLVRKIQAIHFQRILTNCETLLAHCADPDQETLEFHPNITKGLALLQEHRNTVPGTLVDAKVIEVQHAELERIADSVHTSQCPECAPGTLVMKRDSDGVLLPEDTCLFCGQRFKYMDLENMK